jgi:hypothetical protein
LYVPVEGERKTSPELAITTHDRLLATGLNPKERRDEPLRRRPEET